MKNKWNYELAVQYGDPSPHPNGTSMYFDDLADAFRKMLYLDRRTFLVHLDGQKISKATINTVKEGKQLMEVKLVQTKANIKDCYIDTPGIYYHFPGGIDDFQNRSGIDLAHFKPADQQRSIILAAYVVEEERLGLKQTISHEALVQREGGKVQETVPYHIAITRNFFGDGRERERKVHPVPFREEFYYHDPAEAFIGLLGVDYNKLDESVAWEKGLDSFNISSKLIEENRTSIAELLSRRTGIMRIGTKELKEPGIYISGDTKLKELCNGLPFTEGDISLGGTYKVGTYNELRSEARMEQELGRYLRKLKISSQHALTDKMRPKLVKTSPAGRKRKGL